MIADSNLARQVDATPDLRMAAAGFEAVFGRIAPCVASSPGGLTLFGGGGQRFALAVPVRWGAVAAIDFGPDGLVELRTNSRPGIDLSLGSLADAPAWAAPALAPLAGLAGGGVSLLVATVLPDGCGVPTAPAVVTAVAKALGTLSGHEPTVAAWPSIGDVAGQLAASWCPDGAAVLVDEWEHTAEALPFDLAAQGLRLMIVDTGSTTGWAEGGTDAASDGAASDEAAGAGAGAREVPGAAEAVAELRRGDVRAVGRWLDQALAGTPEEVVQVSVAARSAGALGTGVVPGGGLVTLVPEPCLGLVRAAIIAAWPGDRRPRFLTATATRAGRPPIGAGRAPMNW